jgi:iron complex outermembrane receptor protein
MNRTQSITTWTLFLLTGSSTGLLAQEPAQTAAPVPTLPNVNVQADPVPTTSPDDVFLSEGFTPTPLPPSTILQNSIFGTQPVQGYSAPTSTTATFVNVPDLELPASVSTVTRDVIRDQQALRIDDLLRDVSGAVKQNDQLRPDAFVLRGFEVRSRDYRKNGMLDPTYTPRDLANVERVEILKGPSSVLYGAGQPSGTVNLITKKPLAEQFASFQNQIGSFGLNRHTLDTTGPLDDEGQVLYRLNMAYEQKEGFRDFGYNERAFVAPVVTWLIDDDTSLTWEAEYLQDRRRFDTGVVALDGKLGQMPIERFLGEPANDFQLFQDWRQSLFLDHRIDDIWTTRIMATNIFYYAPSSGTFPLSQDPGTTTINRSRQDITQFFEQYHGITANLAGEFLLGNVEHKLVLGTEQGWFVSNNFLSESTIPGLQNLPIDAANPVYSDPNVFFTPAKFSSIYRQNRHGIYFQDVMNFNPHWQAMYGLRYDHADVTFQRELRTFGIPTLPDTETDQSFDRWTPRVGLVYQPLPDVWSIYSSYSRSFDPPSGGPRLTDQPLLPELGESWEIGTKYQFSPKLMGQVAWFWVQKDNYTIDLTTSQPPFFVTSQVGHLTSQGVELSLLGQLTDQWSVVSNYTLTDAVLRDDTNPQLDDRRPRNVPRHTVNLWTRYNIIQTENKRLGGGLGMTYVDDRLASFGGELRLPDYTRWDAGVFYDKSRFNFALLFENLFDRGYYAGSVNDFQIAPGAPFTIRGQAGVTF